MDNQFKKYKCLKMDRYNDQDFYIQPVQNQDIFSIMRWRNEQIDVLRQKTLLTEDKQIEYFNTIVFPEYEKSHPDQILFSFFYKNCMIGYGGLVHIQWIHNRAEVSYLLDKNILLANYTLEELCVILINLFKSVAFEDLNLHKLSTETYSISSERISIIEKADFQLEGRLRDQVLIHDRYYDSLCHGMISKSKENNDV